MTEPKHRRRRPVGPAGAACSWEPAPWARGGGHRLRRLDLRTEPSAGPSEEATGTTGATGTTSAAGKAQVDVSAVPVGGGVVLEDAEVVVTQPEARKFHAFSAVCTHKGCTVNKVADGVIECPLSRKHFQRDRWIRGTRPGDGGRWRPRR